MVWERVLAPVNAIEGHRSRGVWAAEGERIHVLALVVPSALLNVR